MRKFAFETIPYKVMINENGLKNRVAERLGSVKFSLLFPILLVFLAVLVLVLIQGGTPAEAYVNVQKDLFFYLNEQLSKYPNLQFNLTQFGDVLVLFPFLTFFLIYAPKFWEALLLSSLFSLLMVFLLKNIFCFPRPALIFENEKFTIIGELLNGENSTPSGHSTTMFIAVTLVLLVFMPKKNAIRKVLWSIFVLSVGLLVAFSRVGVGAHHPLDVILGACLGYSLVVISIKIATKFSWFSWCQNRKYMPILLPIFIAWIVVLIKKIVEENLPIYYIAMLPLLISSYLITKKCLRRS
ncbi:MAG: phosphatase PAP2 family protein [Flavobacteriaceae bacterium]|nr:phosphatase PAP2 family protein [Flavobacteriaceae bacterium]